MNEEGARWATGEELGAGGWFDASGWPLGRSAYGPVFMPSIMQEASGVVIAPPGAGKSRGVLVPALLSEASHAQQARRSLVVVDPVGELYRLTARTLARTHRILVWNPARPRLSNTYFDPLAYLGTPYDSLFESRCENAAANWHTALAGDQGGRLRGESYWDTQPIAALTGLIIARVATMPGTTMADLAAHVLPMTSEALYKEVAGSTHAGARRRAAVLADLLKNEKAVSGVFGELRRRLLLAVSPTVVKTIGRPSLDVGDLLDRPTVLYLQVGTGEQTLLPLLSVALSTVIAQLLRLTGAGRSLGRHVRVIIDELQNIGELYGLKTSINTLRKYGVGFLLATQTRAGLYAVYGEGVGNAIIGACNTLIGLGGLAPEDAEWFSDQLGRRDWQEMAVDRTWHLYSLRVPTNPLVGAPGSGSFTLPIPYARGHKRCERRHAPLLAPDALRAMDNAMVVIPTRMRPFACSLQLYTGD